MKISTRSWRVLFVLTTTFGACAGVVMVLRGVAVPEEAVGTPALIGFLLGYAAVEIRLRIIDEERNRLGRAWKMTEPR